MWTLSKMASERVVGGVELNLPVETPSSVAQTVAVAPAETIAVAITVVTWIVEHL